jgi:hypothetical protein
MTRMLLGGNFHQVVTASSKNSKEGRIMRLWGQDGLDRTGTRSRGYFTCEKWTKAVFALPGQSSDGAAPLETHEEVVPFLAWRARGQHGWPVIQNCEGML